MKPDTENKSELLDQLVRAVSQSSKYRNITKELIRNIGAQQLSKRQELRAAIKSTKDKLHQICGAYFLQKPNYEQILSKLQDAKESEHEDVYLKTCIEIMQTHSSTKQRLSILNEFYTGIFSLLPPVESVIDVACGLHPVAIPWMKLGDDVRYHAYDVYEDLVAFLNRFMRLTNVKGYAEARDVTQRVPDTKADLAFMLNIIPCFEQIDRSAAPRLMESLQADFLVVSFPVETLGGRKKDMREHYEAMFNKLTREKDWKTKRLDFKAELLFLVEKQP